MSSISPAHHSNMTWVPPHSHLVSLLSAGKPTSHEYPAMNRRTASLRADEILHLTDRKLNSKIASSYSSLEHDGDGMDYEGYDGDGGMIGFEEAAEMEPVIEDDANNLMSSDSEDDIDSVAEGSEQEEEDENNVQNAMIDCHNENIDRTMNYEPDYWVDNEQEEESHHLSEKRLLLFFLPKLQGFDITESYRKITSPPPDHSLSLFPSSPFTTGQFAKDLLDLLDINNINDSVRVALLAVLRKHFPLDTTGVNFPAKKLDNYRSNHLGRHFEEYDVCPSGCMVFVGCGREGLSNSGREFLEHCRKCKQSRYTTENNEVARKTPKAVVHYRPLVPLLVHLCRSEVFRALISYEAVGRASHTSFIFDLLQGEEPKRNISEMNRNHAAWCSSGATEDEVHFRQSFTKVNILLGQFYDGAQVHTTKCTPFWPIYVTILNLPPALRGVVGIGTFLVALDATECEKSTATQTFLFRDCLMQELLLLERGVEDHEYKIRVQARLIQHTLDTKGLEKFLKVQASGSKAGCPFCSVIPGIYRKELRKCVYVGHRSLLSMKNIIRSYGQSGVCCPTHYYPKVEDDGTLTSTVAVEHHGGETLLHPQRICRFYASSSHICVTTENSNNWSRNRVNGCIPRDHDIPEAVCNHKDTIKSIGDVVYFHHLDYREQQDHRRLSNADYLKKVEALYLQYTQRKNRAIVKPLNGIWGLWEPAVLGYSNIETQICYDPLHTLMGVASYIIQNLKNKRAYNKNYNKIRNVHPSVYITNNSRIVYEKKVKKGLTPAEHLTMCADKPHPDWELTEPQQKKLDAWINCIIIPVGNSEDFEVRNVFKRSGMLKGVGKMQLIRCVLARVIRIALANEYPAGYVSYLDLASSIFNKILSPCLDRRTIEVLHDQVIEYVGYHEGVFPESESTFMFHELVDLAKHVRQFGPLKGWWTLFGERAMSFIKQFVPSGGRSFNKTTFKKCINGESAITDKFYESIDNVTSYKGDCFKLSPTGVVLDITFELRLSIPEIYTQKQSFSRYEFCHLVSTLIAEVESNFNRLEDAVKSSCLYRSYCYFMHHRKAIMDYNCYLDWIIGVRKSKVFFNHEIDTIEFAGFKASRNEFKLLSKELKRLQIQIFARVRLLGIELRSRGFAHRESKVNNVSGYGQSTKEYSTSNTINELKYHWDNKVQLSSWCKLSTRLHDINPICGTTSSWAFKKVLNNNKTANPIIELYAQVNAFLVINLSTDSYLNGVCFASVVCRRATSNFCIDAEGIRSYEHNKLYVRMNDIVPTRVGLIALDSNNAPYNFTGNQKLPDSTEYCSTMSRDHLKQLVAIDIDSNRVGIEKALNWESKIIRMQDEVAARHLVEVTVHRTDDSMDEQPTYTYNQAGAGSAVTTSRRYQQYK